MKANRNQSPEPEDLSPLIESSPKVSDWNFKSSKSTEKPQPYLKKDSEKLADVFDSIDTPAAPAAPVAVDEERISVLQKQAQEKRRIALGDEEPPDEHHEATLELIEPTHKKVDIAEQNEKNEEKKIETMQDEEKTPQKRSGFKLLEIILIGIFIAAFGGGLIWVVKNFVFSPQDSDDSQNSKIPAKGQYVIIESMRDFWRKPITTGENPDKPKLGMKLIPVIEVTMGDESQSGILRFFFRDPEGNIAGDPRSVEFEDGLFKTNGSNTIQVSSTTGFTNGSEFSRYKYEDQDFWTVEVFEGRPGQDAEKFNLLFSHDISATFEGKISLDLYE